MSDKSFRVAQKVLLFDKQDRVLIVRFASLERFHKGMWGKWDFPGGGLEWGESLDEGLKREMEEEVGRVEYELGELVTVWDWKLAHRSEVRCVCLLFEAKYLGGEIVLNDEHDKYEWVEVGTLGEYEWTEPDKVVIAKIQEKYG